MAGDPAPLIETGALVLFQGDSITDAGRNRDDPADLGWGYAALTAAWFSAAHPARGARFLNCGVSGDRVKDLRARWKSDCLDLKPAWLSIMIGINDCWRRYDSNDVTDAADFESAYRNILAQARERLGVRLILIEPFLVPVSEDQKRWREDLDPKIEAVRRLGKEFGAILVPLDGLFAEACKSRPPSFWAADGVHPTLPGHALISRALLKSVGAI